MLNDTAWRPLACDAFGEGGGRWIHQTLITSMTWRGLRPALYNLKPIAYSLPKYAFVFPSLYRRSGTSAHQVASFVA